MTPADDFLDPETGEEVGVEVEVEVEVEMEVEVEVEAWARVEDAAALVVEGEVELIHEVSPVSCETMMPDTPPVWFCESVM